MHYLSKIPPSQYLLLQRLQLKLSSSPQINPPSCLPSDIGIPLIPPPSIEMQLDSYQVFQMLLRTNVQP
ncbi:hypothetical protein JTE90_006541 [Oedothorax gibbosus]|uniref:Uncharacterized protein n=1 Tax=Oedothorax gibbosus TaxID=931172 RepID=A0AAV6VM53_9ARAC|nr:hypothetical protein JTE90_006541 [Oedothorax gibbosus]